jgi:SAM-dependent methyltransferase
MTSKNQWEEFFDGHAPFYMDNPFTKNTLAEVDFILGELDIPPGGRVLDMGCGTGRHSVELARRSYRVTGVDISAGMLAQAERSAAGAGVQVEWIKADATQFTTAIRFDAALCLCEGAFGLLGAEDDPLQHDLAILRAIHDALKTSAPFLLTALNGYRMIRQYGQRDIDEGRFDPIDMVERQTIDVETDQGKRTFQSRERGHLPTELALMLHLAGFEIEHVGGGTAGNWSKRPLELDEMEMMVIARRK